MTTLAEFMIIAGVDNRPPMLEESLYDSWKSRMKHYMENRVKHYINTTGDLLKLHQARARNVINMSMRAVQVNTRTRILMLMILTVMMSRMQKQFSWLIFPDMHLMFSQRFDTVVKKRITPDALIEGEWGFEHAKAVFLNEIIPFLNTLKDIFNVFDKNLLNEMFMICVMNSTAVFDDVNVEIQSSEPCLKYVDLDAELLVQKVYKSKALEIPEYFENNDLKAQLQAKGHYNLYVVRNYQKPIRENDKEEKVKHEMDEIETINIELEHSSELGSELTFLAGSELRTSELDTSELQRVIKSLPASYIAVNIQCASSDPTTPMLVRTDFAYGINDVDYIDRGKENRVNILKSIDEGPFQMGTITLAEGNEGALHLGLPKDIYSLINHYTDAKDIWDNVKTLLEGSELTKEDRESQLYDDFEHFRQHKGETIHDYYVRFAKLINDMRNIKMTMSILQLNFKFVNNMLLEWGRFVTAVKLNRRLSPTDNLIENLTNTLALLTQSYKIYLLQTNNQLRTSSNPKNQATIQDGRVVVQNVQGRQNRGQGNNAWGAGAAGGQDNDVDEDMDEQPVQNLALNMDNVFQADDCDAFDFDVDVAPTAQTMFMANLSSVDPVYDEAGLSYDLDVLSEVHDNDHYQDVVCKHHEIHEMHDDVHPNYVVDSHADYTSDSNMISYDQYIKDNAVPVNNVVAKSLTAQLVTYKEQVELYERRARFELTEREQKIDEQLRIVITDRNVKEENLKKELHSIKLQLSSTINHNKSMVEEVTSLKKDFKQKENKYLKEFLDMKALKERVEDKLYKQDQSLQTVYMLCKPKPYYDEKNKVAIGYKNPLCLTRAKQVQLALYNGHEIIKTNHVPAIVHNSEDTLEIAEITRKTMNDKMKDPECVKNRVKIAPPDYSRENYLATFTPKKQLTPEQIFWSNDLIEMKAEALKEQTKASRPIKALTMYPPNTPATLVPRRITPTGLTEGERGFEQTKECYLTEVIPFFKTLKEHFEGIQKALTKEIKEMKDIFEELEAEVDHNVVHRKHAEIERKNLLIANDNLIVDSLSKDVFYITMNSELTVSRFTEMHDAHTVVQARCLELEAELSKLRDKIQTDDHNELVNRFSNLEVNHLNLQLKYQNLKESFVNNPPPPARETPDFDSVFETHSEADRTLDFRTLDFQITQLTEKVTTLQEQNELFRAENGKIKQHYKELYDSIKITRAKHIEQTTALVLAPGKYAIDVEPIPPRNRNNREVHLDYLKHLKESVETIREIVEEAKVERPLDRSLA
ncbi:hypothetical protein Tco_0121790 [Tanacetum coccineum]